MKKFASIILAVLTICTMLSFAAISASAAGVKMGINPDNDGNIIADGSGYSVADTCTINKLEIKSGSIYIGPGVTVTVTESVTIAEGATLEIVGKLEMSENATAQNAGTVKLVCCGTLTDPSHVIQNIEPAHKFDNGEKCNYCEAKCPHEQQFTFCLDCGTVLQNSDTSQGLSFNLPAGESVGTIGPAMNPQDPGIAPVRTSGGSVGGIGLGSVISEGSLTIIVGVAAAVVFGLGGFILGRKKKKKTEE
ncbi:MAG: hypothetical protein KBS52_01205 [Clostridiales bacterium]|nr:hypothetical protein [Candidatus Equinaster intestinalis]